MFHDDGLHLNNILMFGDFVGKRLRLDIELRYGFAKYVQVVFFLTEKWQLR